MFFKRFQELMPGRPLILGHRGAPHSAPENSLESFRIALAAGADGIELDVQITGDGVLVAHHDGSLPSGEKLSELPYKKLKPIAVAAGYGFPQLSEVFELVAGKGLLNIELKQAGHEEAAIRLARGILPVDSFAFSSFDPAAVRTCRRVAPDVPAFLIVWGPQDGARDVAALRELDASGIAFESGHLSAELTRLFCRERFPLFVWTVNDVCEAVRLAEWGVTGIITDIPAELVTAMNPSGKG